jgi:D-sedoheptulose 7-phosphate isomerase
MMSDPTFENRSYAVGYLHESEGVARRLTVQQQEIAQIIDILYNAWRNKKPVFIVGNGGSASTATHFAADLVKTVISNPGDRGIKAMALVDNIPLVSALTNDWGWGEIYTGQLPNFWESGGVVIGISVHGGSGSDQAGAWSQNILRALQFAKDNNGQAIGLAGFDGGAMKDLCDACVIVPAESTPLVESFHVVLTHLITFRLKELINQHEGGE